LPQFHALPRFAAKYDRHFGLQSASACGLYASVLPAQGLFDVRQYVTGERFVTMAGIGQGWIEEAIPTRDGAPKPAALLLGSILLLTSP
jgi:hypothetical protein